MKLRWTNEQIGNFKMPTAERVNWITNFLDKYSWWIYIGILISATVWIWIKIYQLYQIRLWLENL